jgi:hypothetical protein
MRRVVIENLGVTARSDASFSLCDADPKRVERGINIFSVGGGFGFTSASKIFSLV